MPETNLRSWIEQALAQQPIRDLHTHLYPPSFGNTFCLFGIDEILTYHYLIAEYFRARPPSHPSDYNNFFSLPKPAQADLIWKTLFVDHTPLSEATRGVLTTLHLLGLDPNETTLTLYRRFFADKRQNPSAYLDEIMRLANVESITMTNNVFDDAERSLWLTPSSPAALKDPRFKPVLRIDLLVLDPQTALQKLASWNYDVSPSSIVTPHEMRGSSLPLDARTIEATKHFLRDWLDRMGAVYIAMSLPPDFHYPPHAPGSSQGHQLLEQAILPICQERNLPLALMIGATRQINPLLRDAGDSVGLSDVTAVTHLCRQFPATRFLVTMLARENQHELAVAARKFPNLTPFGCWWFLNIPSQIAEITQVRLELLGTAFIPQHSDARVLEHLLYKWHHTRQVLAEVLTNTYTTLATTGYHLTQDLIRRDIKLLLNDNVTTFTGP